MMRRSSLVVGGVIWRNVRLLSTSATAQQHWKTTHYMAVSRENDPRWKDVDQTRMVDEADVVIVGGGPGGLAAAIRLRQLAMENDRDDFRVCLFEKAVEMGGHMLSGAVIDPKPLAKLIPDYKDKGAPVYEKVQHENLSWLTETRAIKMPILKSSPLNNHGNYIIRLGRLVKWMSDQAEELGVEVYPGFPAQELVYHDDGSVKGIATPDMGIAKDGSPKDTYEPGMEFHAPVTILAEGCRGHLTKAVKAKHNLDENCQEMTHAIGVKELWQLPPEKYKKGYLEHTAGWPLDLGTYGGSFVYHIEEDGEYFCALGLVVALDYKNTYLNPYKEMQRWKTHPVIRKHLEGATRIGYGARALNEGGVQCLPKLTFPGGCLVGCTAGFMNVSKLKGVHTAIETGMYAAEATFHKLKQHDSSKAKTKGVEPVDYEKRVKSSAMYKEMWAMRNLRPSFKWGGLAGIAYNGVMWTLLRGNEPWTLKHHSGHDGDKTLPAAQCKPIDYPKPDGVLTFDLLDSLLLSNTNHQEDQPSHLTLKKDGVPETINYPKYAGPEQRYCPAGVYEFVPSEDGKSHQLQINAQNCVHCKTCDIKDCTANIDWVAPEPGGGPSYDGM